MKKQFLLLGILVSFLFVSCQKQTPEDQSASFELQSFEPVNSLTSTGPKKILFDAKHAQTAGNADWVIDQDNNIPQRIPSPLQSGITATTHENYWTGAISAWAISMVRLGTIVETLPSSGSLTYGVSTNAQDLLNYDVLVIDEPNIRFTTPEKTAILNFVRNGGGLFMIGNHSGSDRNNDGWDAPAIWNDLMSSNSVQANPFGIRYDLVNFSETSTNVTTLTHPIIKGTQGTVSSLKYNGGTSVTLTSGSNARGLFWKSRNNQGLKGVMAAYSSFGTGRIIALGDSSPSDDGTGAANNQLFPNWYDLSGNHTRFFLNGTLWLAKLQ